MDQVQHYASVEKRKHLELGVARERTNRFCSVDRPLHSVAEGEGGGGGGDLLSLNVISGFYVDRAEDT